MTDRVTVPLDNDDYVINIFLDFAEVYDPVNHSILKLCHYGIRSNAPERFRSYLSDKINMCHPTMFIMVQILFLVVFAKGLYLDCCRSWFT